MINIQNQILTMKTYKSDFPIFANNPWLVFLDSGASAQKPSYVIEKTSEFTAQNYANIHRGSYQLSEQSEEIYHKSKSKLASFLSTKNQSADASEIFYSYNATYAINIIAQALCNSQKLGEWDTVLLGIWDHHANITSRQSLAKIFKFQIKFIPIKEDYTLDWEDFAEKYDETVKVVACSQVSNVTGQMYEVEKIWKIIQEKNSKKTQKEEKTFFLVDGSQSFPHFAIDVENIWCDAFVGTGHKVMAYTGIGFAWMKKQYIKELQPLMSGGGTVKDVNVDWFSSFKNTDKREMGTPNIIGAASLLYALEYIENIWGIDKIWEHDQKIVKLMLEKLVELPAEQFQLIGSQDVEKRIGNFSFLLDSQPNFNALWETFAKYNIAVRCGGHCAYPLHKSLQIGWTCRASFYLYNDEEDVEKFINTLKTILWS